MVLKYKSTVMSFYSRASLLTFSLLFTVLVKVSAQESTEDRFPIDQKTENGTPSFRDRLFFGGNFGLMLGSVTDIQISPVVGYWLLPRIAVATGPTYRYYKDYLGKTSIYGGKAYVQLVIIQDLNSFIPMGVHTGLFLHCEDELLSLKANFWKRPLNPRGRFYLNTVLVGGGISQQIGKRASMNFMVLWPINDSNYDIYSKPEVRVSFTF